MVWWSRFHFHLSVTTHYIKDQTKNALKISSCCDQSAKWVSDPSRDYFHVQQFSWVDDFHVPFKVQLFFDVFFHLIWAKKMKNATMSTLWNSRNFSLCRETYFAIVWCGKRMAIAASKYLHSNERSGNMTMCVANVACEKLKFH